MKRRGTLVLAVLVSMAALLLGCGQLPEQEAWRQMQADLSTRTLASVTLRGDGLSDVTLQGSEARAFSLALAEGSFAESNRENFGPTAEISVLVTYQDGDVLAANQWPDGRFEMVNGGPQFLVSSPSLAALLKARGFAYENAQATTGTTQSAAAVTTTRAAVTSTSEPSTTETQPGDSSDGPVLSQLPTLSPSDLAYVGVSSELGGEAWSLLLSPVGQPEQLAALLAAYDRTVLENRPQSAPSSDNDSSQSLQVHFALKSGGEVFVLIEPPGPDTIVRWDPDLGKDEHPPTASADATPLAELIRQLLAPEGSTTPRIQAFSLPAEMPADFGFLLGYGTYAKNVLDTFSGTFTKDLINPWKPTATTDLRLNEKELANVYGTLRQMDIMGYPTHFDPESSNNGTMVTLTPHPSYYLMIRAAGKQQVVRFEDAHESTAPKATALRDLIRRIQHNMIEEKPEFKALPLPMGGYA